MQDAGGLTSTATVTIMVRGVNNAPTAEDDTALAVEDEVGGSRRFAYGTIHENLRSRRSASR